LWFSATTSSLFSLVFISTSFGSHKPYFPFPLTSSSSHLHCRAVRRLRIFASHIEKDGARRNYIPKAVTSLQNWNTKRLPPPPPPPPTVSDTNRPLKTHIKRDV
jgi:hypothetical protein